MINAANPEQVKKQEELAKRIREQELNDLRFILRTKEGRRFFCRLIERCRQYQTSFTGNSHTFLYEGMRNVALMLLQDIEALGVEGLELKHMAEREYYLNQLELREIGGTSNAVQKQGQKRR